MTLSLFDLPAEDTPLRLAEVSPEVRRIEALDEQLERQFESRLVTDSRLSRRAVSFQSSKTLPRARWFKFKEAFSPLLVRSLLEEKGVTGTVLDPFAGSGTTLFAASELGLPSYGIEVLPIGCALVAARLTLEREFLPADFARLRAWRDEKIWRATSLRVPLTMLRITDGAYPPETLDGIERFVGAMVCESERVALALEMVLLCVLESVSWTRKDGQYLRWDARAGRRIGAKPFDKGRVLPFDEAVCCKIDEVLNDCLGNTSFLPEEIQTPQAPINLFAGSCLEQLPQMQSESCGAIVTSPPYCNRYDYTRTYALELALLGVSGEELVALRQQMLSCTVENRAKDLLAMNPRWSLALDATRECELLEAINDYLENQRVEGHLNNTGIARMVRGYFLEMACVIQEAARLSKPGAPLWMVNDNVRYAGVSISVDLILSSIAERVGLEVEQIAVLPSAKGNSSQQMGTHGRSALRKCVYVWRKPR